MSNSLVDLQKLGKNLPSDIDEFFNDIYGDDAYFCFKRYAKIWVRVSSLYKRFLLFPYYVSLLLVHYFAGNEIIVVEKKEKKKKAIKVYDQNE